MTVLIIEDNPINLELVAALLEVAGHEVLQAPTADIGIRLAQSGQPDLILVDIGLPGMDGLEAVRRIRADPQIRTMPILALTAHAMASDEISAREAGCDGYFTKPIDTRTFVKSVSAYVTVA